MNNNAIFESAKKSALRYNSNALKGRNDSLIKQLNINMEYIKDTYSTLSKFSELGISTHLAGEWILDNYYAIQKESYAIEEAINNANWTGSQIKSYIKIYDLVFEFIKNVDGKINVENIREFLNGYTQAQYISIEELWALPVIIKMALIHNIKEICENIMYVEKQKYKVESIIERNIINTKSKDRKFNIVFKEKNKIQINLPFIEYMAYRLRELGEVGREFVDIFDNQVIKLGTTVDDVVAKQHLEVAINQMSIGNSIMSLKNINSINFSKEFIYISDIDVILSKEKANIYTSMNDETKKLYRDKICTIARKMGVSEKYICSQIVELCNEGKGIKSHSGYYIFSEGIRELYNVLGVKYKKEKSLNKKLFLYISTIIFLTILTTILFSYIILPEKQMLNLIVCFVLLFIPISQIYVYIIDKLLLKRVKPNILPGLNFEYKIPKQYSTMVIIPTLISSTKRVKELIKQLEEMYLTNKQDNIFFAILGDCSESDFQKDKLDEEILNTGREEINKLNEKYKFDINKFYFLYRKRKYNPTQEKYLGWERKRGMITQFNRLLLYGEQGDFYDVDINRQEIGDIKYVVTVDADTQIGINNVSKLAGIMAHPLNEPILNENMTVVEKGYGILQPRISTSIKCASQNIFSKVWAGYGGIDNYTNAVSDIYQDIWQEGIFTGKGIYNLKIFSKVLDNQIPENTVLSHDLLEGSFLRCGLVTNVEFVDGFPSRFNSYIVRQNRWLRGDLQVFRWCKNKVELLGEKCVNPLNNLSKWKIVDNIRRGIVNISLFIFILVGLGIFDIHWVYILSIFFAIYVLPCILDKMLNIKGAFSKNRSSTHMIGAIENVIYKSIFEFMFLPYVAISNIETFIKSIYRINFSKKYMLEWMTAEQAEKVLGKNLQTYTNEMYISGLWAIALVITVLIFSSNPANYIAAVIFAILWIISPFVAWKISEEKENDIKINNSDREFLIKTAKDTWEYFNRYLIKENNYLIPDNYQENRDDNIVYRTSSTNIGLSFMAIISAYDMKFIDINTAKQLIKNILDTINKLKKYKGNIYNWYDIKTLEPLNDAISSVDNGNYISYLYVLLDFCKNELKDNELEYIVKENIMALDFSIFYNSQKQLFSIEYNAKTGEVSNSYYDLLASESRVLSYVAIAKGDVPYEHWYRLSRALTNKLGMNGLLSWTGTSFEYYMPYALMKTYKYSLIDESYEFVFRCQREYLKNRNMPWGISESAFNLYDLEYNYQYKAFGIPWLGLKRGLKQDLVISPYASILMLPKHPNEVIKNMRELINVGAYGKYGFFDAVDYTKERIGSEPYVVVKTFMAHHQGLILMSINNSINNMIMQKRFHNNPEISAVDILLQEKNNNTVLIKNNLNNGIYGNKKNNNKNEMFDINLNQKNCYVNVLSNKNYSIVTNKDGYGYSKLDDVYIYRYNGDKINRGFNIYIKDIKNDSFDSCLQDSQVLFNLYTSTFSKSFNDIEVQTMIWPLEQGFGECRNVRIKNNRQEEAVLEVLFYTEPIITKLNNDLSHRAYSNMFLQYEKMGDAIVINRRKKELHERNVTLAAKIVNSNQGNMHVEFEIDRYKFIGRNKNMYNANMLKGNVPFSNNLLPTIEPILCFKVSIKIPKDGCVNIPFVLCVNDDKQQCINNINKYTNYDNVKDELSLAYNKALIETNFYKYSFEEVEQCNKIISYILNNKNKYAIVEDTALRLEQCNIWSLGISGDKPIVVLNISRKIEAVYIKKILKAYKYIKRKGIDFDLVIYIKSNKEYTEQIYQEIIRYIGINGLRADVNYGIYIVDKNSVSENVECIIKSIACLILDCKQYSAILKDKDVKKEDEETGINDMNYPIIPNKAAIINYDTSNLLYYNEIGGFANGGKEYQIILNNGFVTPAPWVNVIANTNFGVITSECGIVYSWANNSSQNKLSKWKNDQVINNPSEFIEISEPEEDRKWSISAYPYFDSKATYGIKYAKGYTVYESNINDVFSTQKVFVPNNDKCHIDICTLENKSGKRREFIIEYNLEVLLGNEVSKKIYNIKESPDYLMLQNVYSNMYSNEIMYMFGMENDINKDSVDTNCKFDFSELKQGKGFVKISKKVLIEAYSTKNIYFVIGQENKEELIKEKFLKYRDYTNIDKEFEQVVQFWNDMTSKIKIRTPVDSMNILINEWLIYQTISSRLYARSGYYQSGGAFGFRDQLQDVLSVMYVNPSIAKKQILYHAKHQYIQGDVQHWWHHENSQGIRSRYSDDMLWLAYVVLEYIKVTGDEDILNENASYVQSEVLSEHEKERYEVPQVTEYEETIFNHICRAIDRSINFAENNLPNIGSGDWSDGLNNLYGQSVWLGFFLYYILKEFIPFVKNIDDDRYNQYMEAINKLSEGLGNCWDGKWYKRAFFKDGSVLGSSQNDECKIDVIVQAWATIAQFGEQAKRLQALEAVDDILVDRDNKIIKLFSPSFNSTILEPGYIKAYIPGIRENGGQYTHGAIWNIMANAINGKGDLAEEYFRMLNPIEHARTNEACRKFKVEPYVIPADVYSAPGLEGRGGWSWYTGSASWMYKVGIEYILGLKIRGNSIEIQPCINSRWAEYEMCYRYQDTQYNIHVSNPNAKQTGVSKVFLDNQLIDNNKIVLVNDKLTHNINVIM